MTLAVTTIPPRLGYVAGSSYSGSTLLSFLLDGHPQAASVGEMGPSYPETASNYLCSCGRRIAECPFYLRIRDILVESGVPFDPTDQRMIYRLSSSIPIRRLTVGPISDRRLARLRTEVVGAIPPFRQRIAATTRRNIAFMQAILYATDKQLFVDASKNPERIQFFRRAGLDPYVIHLVRHPAAYCHSARKRRPGRTVADCARSWVRTNKAITGICDQLAEDHRMRLTYEDLASELTRTYRLILDFLDLAPMRAPASYQPSSHHIMGNKMRTSHEAAVTVALDEQWRSTLTARERQEIEGITGTLARRLGYYTY